MKKSIVCVCMLFLVALPLLTVARITEFQLIQAINNGTGIPMSGGVAEFEAESTKTNTVQTGLKVTHTTSGTPANGIGVGIGFVQETATAGNEETIMKIDAVTTDVTGTSEDADFVLSLQAGGTAAAEKLRVSSTGLITLVNAETIDNTVNGTVTITSPVVATSAALNVGTALDVQGGDIVLQNDETIGNAVNGTVLVTATTLATTGGVDFGGDIVLQNDETIGNAVNGTVLVTATTLATTGGVDFGGDIVMQNDEFISNSTDGTLRLVSPTITNSATTVSNTMGTTGGLSLKVAEATATLSGASATITLDIPTGAKLVGAQLRVDTLITSGDGATSWGAVYAGGATATIATTQAFTKDTKVDSFFYLDGTDITSNTTNITISPNSNTFSGGVVRAIVYYYVFEAMANAP